MLDKIIEHLFERDLRKGIVAFGEGIKIGLELGTVIACLLILTPFIPFILLFTKYKGEDRK